MNEANTETAVSAERCFAFLAELANQLRAQDTYGNWDRKSDVELLEPYVLDHEKRHAIPIIGDPDPETLWYVELFFNAVALTIERETGVMVTPMMKMHHEGFGRVVLCAGRLIAVNRQLRDVHRFGFPSMEKLATAGARLVTDGIVLIRKYPEVANYS